MLSGIFAVPESPTTLLAIDDLLLKIERNIKHWPKKTHQVSYLKHETNRSVILFPQHDLSFASDASAEMSIGNNLIRTQFQFLLKNKMHF